MRANTDTLKERIDPLAVLADPISRAERAARSPAEAVGALVRLLGGAGVLDPVVPASYGGARAEIMMREVCRTRERLAYISTLADQAFATQFFGSFPLTLAGSAELKARWLPLIVGGEAVAAFALAEPGVAGDLQGLATTATRTDGGYVLRGAKVRIASVGAADFYVVFAVTDPTAGKRQLSAFVVPSTAPGLATTAGAYLGAHVLGDLALTDVEVSAEARVGDEGDGIPIALATLARMRAAHAGAAVGLAQRALDLSVAHARTHRVKDQLLADLPSVQLRVAEMACAIESARALTHLAASACDEEASRSIVARASAMAKLVATESAQCVADHAIEIVGASGIERGAELARIFEHVRAMRAFDGGGDAQRFAIARAVLGHG